ncbi:hypothetical protein Aperf_G00000060629 [Anoplocephala perfoliata]
MHNVTFFSLFDRYVVPDRLTPEQCGKVIGFFEAAVFITVSLLEAAFPNIGARILPFIICPGTQKPIAVIDDDLKNVILSPHDVKIIHYLVHSRDKSPSNRMAQNCHALDVTFTPYLGQNGQLETRYLNFQILLGKDATGHFEMGFAEETIVCQRIPSELKEPSCTGNYFSPNMKTASTSENEVLIAGYTSLSRLNGLTLSSMLGSFFEVTRAHGRSNIRSK